MFELTQRFTVQSRLLRNLQSPIQNRLKRPIPHILVYPIFSLTSSLTTSPGAPSLECVSLQNWHLPSLAPPPSCHTTATLFFSVPFFCFGNLCLSIKVQLNVISFQWLSLSLEGRINHPLIWVPKVVSRTFVLAYIRPWLGSCKYVLSPLDCESLKARNISNFSYSSLYYLCQDQASCMTHIC